jgi:2'-5' RNA ligase
MGKLQRDLENSLLSSVASAKEDTNSGNRPYAPHITLGRIRQWEFRQIELEERPQVEEEISLSFEINSIEVMESELKRGGAEYTVLESIPLSSQD